jgi:hypothetical protein
MVAFNGEACSATFIVRGIAYRTGLSVGSARTFTICFMTFWSMRSVVNSKQASASRIGKDTLFYKQAATICIRPLVPMWKRLSSLFSRVVPFAVPARPISIL